MNIAVSIVEEMSKSLPIRLDVYGPSANDIPRRIVKSPVVQVKGWQTFIPWTDYDMLLHPAYSEPFGMVVSEARRHGVPALISSITGSKDMGFSGVRTCGIEEPIAEWRNRMVELLEDDSARLREVRWTWKDLAELHVKNIYSSFGDFSSSQEPGIF